ncbi:hypothetical protein ACOBV8_15435 [Pseudoalteromonas espejiana]
MKKLSIFTFLLFIFVSSTVFAKGSFRLDNGNLLSVGKTKSDIIATVGAPIYEDVLNEAVDIGNGDKLIKKKSLPISSKGQLVECILC